MYTIVPSPQFEKEYGKLELQVQRQIDKSLGLLRENPHHPSLRTHKRRGEGNIWQARVTRDYRLYFEMEGEVIRLLSVTSHEK